MIEAFIGSGEKTIIEGQIKAVYIDTDAGNIGILDNHENMISSIKNGEMRIVDINDNEQIYTISDGVLRVENNGDKTIVNILLEEIDNIDSLNEEAINEAIKRAQEIRESGEEISVDIIDRQIFRDMNKIKSIQRHRNRI